jgi:hypothetical protein
MRPLILLLLLFSKPAFGVEIHPNGFSNIPAGSGTHYSGRLMQWSIWQDTPAHDDFGLPFSYIADATRDSGDPSLNESDFESLEGQTDSAINLLMNYYYDRETDYPETQVQAEAVFSSKIQVDLPSSLDISNVSVDQFIRSFVVSDRPHAYTAVSPEWVEGFLPNFHSAKESISESSRYFLVTINASESVYNCPMLNFGLSMNDDALVDFGGAAHLFMLIKIDEAVNVSNVRGIESGANRVFVQEIIYSTSFIRAGKNIISVYNEGSNSKLISQNAIVITDRVMSVPEILVNPLDLNRLEQVGAVASMVGGSDDEFILSSRNVEIINSNSGECGVGLGLGVASYTYNIARMMVESLAE